MAAADQTDTMADAESRTGPRKAEKSDSPTRWLVLMLACFAMIGNYYCFDNPAALKVRAPSAVASQGPHPRKPAER